MADVENNTPPVVPEVTPPVTPPADDDFKAKLAAAVAEELKDIKLKLDKAHSQRDEVIAQSEALKQQVSDQKAEQLKAEGKHVEALELKLAESEARVAVLARRNIELTRDLEIKQLLSGYDFRSDKASKMAFAEVTSQLTQNEDGSWKGTNGDPVEKVIKDFMVSEDNEFLLKPKSNSGGGTPSTPSTPSSSPSPKKSLFELTQAEVIQMAAEGKFRK